MCAGIREPQGWLASAPGRSPVALLAVPSLKESLAHVHKPAYKGTFGEAMWVATSTLTVYAVIFATLVHLSNAGASLALLIPIALVKGAVDVRIFIIQHDCGHGSFFPPHMSKYWNLGMANVMAIFCVTPTDWKVSHNEHHAHSGNAGQIEYGWNDTVWHTREAWFGMSESSRKAWKTFRHPVPFFILAPALTWWLSFRVPDETVHMVLKYYGMYGESPTIYHRTSNKLINTTLMVARYGLIAKAWGLQMVALTMFAEWFGAFLGIVMFHTQHAFEQGYLCQENAKWNYVEAALVGSSFLQVPWWFKWFTMGIEYHHIHHLSTKVPGYRLKQCHEEAPAHLFADNIVTKLYFGDFCRSVQLQAYDESIERFVTFAELEATAGSTAKKVD